jgi:hypothetical protein
MSFDYKAFENGVRRVHCFDNGVRKEGRVFVDRDGTTAVCYIVGQSTINFRVLDLNFYSSGKEVRAVNECSSLYTANGMVQTYLTADHKQVCKPVILDCGTCATTLEFNEFISKNVLGKAGIHTILVYGEETADYLNRLWSQFYTPKCTQHPFTIPPPCVINLKNHGCPTIEQLIQQYSDVFPQSAYSFSTAYRVQLLTKWVNDNRLQDFLRFLQDTHYYKY